MLLDGPTGTELQRRGVETNVPGWTAAAIESAPDILLAIHRDYVATGAEVLTANTFRTHSRNVRSLVPDMAAAAADRLAAQWTWRAVEIARAAASESNHKVWIAGSQAPLGDCYEAGQTPDDAALEREHRRMSDNLAAAGVDLILVETHPTLREALAATRAALATGLPVITSCVCNRAGRMLSGESLADAASAIARLPIAAVGVNCILADDGLTAVQTLRQTAPDRPVAIYANVGWFTPELGWRNSDSIDPQVYATHAAQWLTAGARLIGTCCGTTPQHIARLRQLIAERDRCDGPAA